MTSTPTTDTKATSTAPTTGAAATDTTAAKTPSAAGSADAESRSFSSGIRTLAPFAREDRAQYALSAALAVAGTVCQLGPFWVIYRAVSDVVEGSASRDGLFGLAVLALVFVVAEHAFMATSTYVSHRAAFATLHRLRLRIGDRLSRVPLGFVTRRRSGEIQRTLTEDVERLELFLAHAIPDLVAAGSVVALTTGWLFVVDWRMALSAVASVALALVLMSMTTRRGGAKMGDYLAAMARMNGSVVEFVHGLPVIKTFNRTGESFAETRDAVRAAAAFQAGWGREFLPLMTAFYTVAASAALTIVPVGLWLWLGGGLGTTELLFFFVLGLAYTAPVLRLTELLSQLSLLTLGSRLVSELHGAPELPEPAQHAALSEASVEFSSVDFGYPAEVGGADRQALAGVSFTARPDTVTALVGPSGAGKSTIARLICRFYDVDAGSVRVGGVDVREQPFRQLMEQVAFVFQETFLFDDTVAANIRLGRPDATDAEVTAAAAAAQAHVFITALSAGYDTRIGERGARLSGGEKQRLAIARAILKDAPVVVLDEATAFADPENEAALQDALTALIAGRTLIMIAHRLSTVAGADQILVVDGGRIVERGRHRELLAAGGLYARLWEAFADVEFVALGAAVHGAELGSAGRVSS